MTDRAAFSNQEWDLLVEFPRWVAQAASAAEKDSPRHTAAEEEAGLLAIAEGRRSTSNLVATVATELVEYFDEPRAGSTAGAISFRDAPAGLATVLEHAATVTRMLAEKADFTDADAYRRWMLAITDMVIGTAHSGALLGIGGDSASPKELRFREQLAATLRHFNAPA